MMIVNCSLTMITSCNKMVNFNYLGTSVVLVLSEQLLCNWRTTFMCMIMPHVRLNKDP
jgi:hypothetical protein